MDFVVFDNRDAELVDTISADLVNQNRGLLFGDGFFTTGQITDGKVLYIWIYI